MPKMPAHHCHTCLQWQRKVCTAYARTLEDHPPLDPEVSESPSVWSSSLPNIADDPESHLTSKENCFRRAVQYVATPIRTGTPDTGRERNGKVEKRSRKGAGEHLINDSAGSRDQGHYQDSPQLVGMRMRPEGAASSSLRSRANHSYGDCERWLQLPVASGRPFTHPSEEN